MRVFLQSVIGLATLQANGAFAEEVRYAVEPQVGIVTVVGAGEDAVSVKKFIVIDEYRLLEDHQVKSGTKILLQVPRGYGMIAVEHDDGLKVCAPRQGTFVPIGPCYVDRERDGLFDGYGEDELDGPHWMKNPLKYEKVAVSTPTSRGFTQTIVYDGATKDTLLFSYREFMNGLARPAFTESITVPREVFPEIVVVKGVRLEIFSVSGAGLKYRILSGSKSGG